MHEKHLNFITHEMKTTKLVSLESANVMCTIGTQWKTVKTVIMHLHNMNSIHNCTNYTSCSVNLLMHFNFNAFFSFLLLSSILHLFIAILTTKTHSNWVTRICEIIKENHLTNICISLCDKKLFIILTFFEIKKSFSVYHSLPAPRLDALRKEGSSRV